MPCVKTRHIGANWLLRHPVDTFRTAHIFLSSKLKDHLAGRMKTVRGLDPARSPWLWHMYRILFNWSVWRTRRIQFDLQLCVLDRSVSLCALSLSLSLSLQFLLPYYYTIRCILHYSKGFHYTAPLLPQNQLFTGSCVCGCRRQQVFCRHCGSPSCWQTMVTAR